MSLRLSKGLPDPLLQVHSDSRLRDILTRIGDLGNDFKHTLKHGDGLDERFGVIRSDISVQNNGETA